MKKTTNTTEEKTLLKPFPFNEGEDYLLKLKDGNYVAVYWNHGQFYSPYSDQYVEEDIESIVSLKELGL